MDIIAAHQQGLIEQLHEEASAMAGRARDHGQRAVVLHHLYDHSRGAHGWALSEARRAVRIARGVATLENRIDRWWWMIADRKQARAAVEQLADALGEAARARCAGAYLAYRLSATPALRSEAEQRLPPELLEALDQCHAARRAGEHLPIEACERLAAESEAHARRMADAGPPGIAWWAIDASALSRAAHRLLGDKALTQREARDRKRGWSRIERELRHDPTLPASFRANPAQHFYALLHALSERRRQQWREACDREPDAFELAA